MKFNIGDHVISKDGQYCIITKETDNQKYEVNILLYAFFFNQYEINELMKPTKEQQQIFKQIQELSIKHTELVEQLKESVK